MLGGINMCSSTVLVEECISFWRIGRSFKFPVKMPRSVFAIKGEGT